MVKALKKPTQSYTPKPTDMVMVPANSKAGKTLAAIYNKAFNNQKVKG